MAVELTLHTMSDKDIIQYAKGKEVRNRRDVDLSVKNSSVPEYSGGLYDPSLFGKTKVCKCKITRVQAGEKPKQCPNCKTLVFGTEEEYRNNLAFYRLHAPYIFPYKAAKFMKVLGSMGIYPISVKNGNNILKLWNSAYSVEPAESENEATLVKDGQLYKLVVSEVSEHTPYDEIGLIGLYELQNYKLKNGGDINFEEYLNTVLPIISTAFRHYNIMRLEKPILSLDEKTIQYKAIIEMNDLFPSYSREFMDSSIDRATVLYDLNMLIAWTTNHTDLLESGKEHTLRDNLRQRIKRSGRTNIIPALDIDMNHVKIPKSVAYTALNRDIIQRMIDDEGLQEYEAQQEYRNQSPRAMKALNKIIEECMVVIWRNPTLHKYNLVALHPILTDDPATGIPIDICGIMNGDFDGDQMGYIFVTEPDIIAQLQSDMTPEQIWFYEKEAKPTFVPTHEILYGLHLATTYGKMTPYKFATFEQAEQAYQNGKIEYNDTIMVDDKKTTYGRKKIETILHMDLDAGLGQDVPIDTKNISKLISGLSTHRRRAEETHELTQFAAEIVTHVGMGALPFAELYDKNDPKVKSIIESDEPLAVRYNKLNDYIATTIDNKIANLEGSSLPSMLKGSGRVKKSQLEEIYSPVVYMDGDEITISNSTLFGGLTERDFVTKGIENRQIQAIKRFGVPVGGYATRQMVMAQMDIIFDARDASPDKIGLEIPLAEATGRTRMNGDKVSDAIAQRAAAEDEQYRAAHHEENPNKKRVRVKSCINHSDKKVYADEIDQKDLKEKDGAAIGISFAMSLTEAKTQAALALKHGGIKTGFENVHSVAQSSGTVVSIDSEYLILMTNDGREEKYLMTDMVVPNVKVGARVSQGQQLISSRRLRQLHDQLADYEAFLGIQNVWDFKLTREAERGLVVRYAPCTGIIAYPNPWTIKIGDMAIPVNRKELYYYPEGYKIEVGKPFCSGVLNMHEYLRLNKNIQVSFDVFKSQMLEIYPEHKTRSELFEVTFKGLMNSKFSAKQAYTGTDNFVNRLYSGDTRRGLEKFYKESPDNVIRIQDSIILPLALGFDTRELNG